MLGKRAQIATEYLIITIFILIVVVILFTYSYINYEQNVKINQVNNVLDSLVNKADYVYSLGPGNVQYVEIALPVGTTIEIVNLCKNGEQYSCPKGDEEGCNCTGEGGIRASAIQLSINLVGGPVKITRPSKAQLVLADDDQPDDDEGKKFPCTEGSEFCDGKYRIRVCWNDSSDICGDGCPTEKICLKKV